MNNISELSNKVGTLRDKYDQLEVESKKFEADVRAAYNNLSEITRMLHESRVPIRGGLIGQIIDVKKASGQI